MIDVSKFTRGARCPWCIERRVYAVDIPRDRWMCVPNAMPIPWRRDQVIEHDATEFDNDEDRERDALFSQLLASGELRMI